MSINDHSVIAPSSFSITLPCPGSVQLQQKVPPQPDTEEIAEGKAAHMVAASFLAGTPIAVGAKIICEGREWIVDEDMVDGAELWADTMGVGYCSIEQPVHIPRIHPECWGTPDASRIDVKLPDDFTTAWPRKLTVGDYKYGHRYVDPFENLQVGAGYASGLCSKYEISTGDDSTVVEIVVVQPRAFHRDGPVQRWTTTPFGLNKLVVAMRDAAALALGTNPPTATGGHCRDCKARAICGTMRASVAHIVDFSGTIEPQQLDTRSAAIELRILAEAAARLDARRTGLHAQVEAAARCGEQVPYWMMEPGQAKLEWNPDVTVDELRGLGAMFGVDLERPKVAKTMMITPTQAIDRKKVDASVIAQYATRKPGGVTLKPDTGTKARKVFGAK